MASATSAFRDQHLPTGHSSARTAVTLHRRIGSQCHAPTLALEAEEAAEVEMAEEEVAEEVAEEVLAVILQTG